jgi:hypothetical protein
MYKKQLLYVPILVISALLSLYCAPAYSGGTASKPQAPVKITIEAAQPGVTPDSIKPGDVVDLIVTAVSFVDTDAMNITVIIPDGAVLISGDLLWTGPSKKGEKKTIAISIRTPQKGTGEIRAEMSIAIDGSKAFSTSSRYTPGATTKMKPESARPVKKDSKGQDVVEYE